MAELPSQRLRQLRLEQGLSQVGLSKISGVHVATINQIENGARRASTLTLERLAKSLGVPVAAFFLAGESPKDKAPRLVNEFHRAARNVHELNLQFVEELDKLEEEGRLTLKAAAHIIIEVVRVVEELQERGLAGDLNAVLNLIDHESEVPDGYRVPEDLRREAIYLFNQLVTLLNYVSPRAQIRLEELDKFHELDPYLKKLEQARRMIGAVGSTRRGV